MASEHTSTVWVMHAGALGDWVMVWPLLRSLGRRGVTVIAVTHDSKGALAAEWIECAPGSVIALPGGIDQARLSRWWAGPDGHRGEVQGHNWRVPAPDRIITFLCDHSTSAGRVWLSAAATEFPRVTLEAIGTPGSESRRELWRREQVDSLGAVPVRTNPHGLIVCHIGAGSNDKRWPVARWVELVAMIRSHGIEARLLAGEVERERLAAAELAAFANLGGRFIDSLDDLAAFTASARLFIGADTGPTHLAAQLGVPTLALFGPTNPAIWAPVGPAVRVLAPESQRAMEWLSPDQVDAAAIPLLAYTSPP